MVDVYMYCYVCVNVCMCGCIHVCEVCGMYVYVCECMHVTCVHVCVCMCTDVSVKGFLEALIC